MEQEPRTSSGVTRGQNALYVMPHDWASIAHFLTPALERVDPSVTDTQVLVVTADAEAAAAVAAASVRLLGAQSAFPLAATGIKRAERLLKLRPATLVAGSPDVLLALVQSAALKLDQLRAVVLAWPDDPSSADEAALENLLGEVPKDSPRTIVTSAITPAIEALVERYARRARRIGAAAGSEVPTALEYVSVAGASRLTALRRLLDEQDPASALAIVRSDESEQLVGELLRSLGYAGADAPVRVSRAGTAAPVDVVILYDLPASREELREAVGAHAGRVIVLIQPRQLATIRNLAAGGTVTPLTLVAAGTRARSRDADVRAELRARLSSGTFGRELLALEPLLDEWDGIEIAAAALQLLERARASERPAAARVGSAAGATPAPSRASSGASATASGGAMVRLFVNVGTMDSVRPADLVGAIVNEVGLPREGVGRIELRDNHSLVEITSDRAEEVATKLTGTSIRGRRVQARIDQERGARAHGPARGGRTGGGGRPRGERSFEDRPRGNRTFNERGAPRGERDRGERPRNRPSADDRGGARRGPRRDDRNIGEGRGSRDSRAERE